MPRGSSVALPDPQGAPALLDAVLAALFPAHHGRNRSQVACTAALGRALAALARPVVGTSGVARTWAAVRAEIPAIQEVLAHDVAAAVERDPAATGADEVILCYPGLVALAAHRVAHALHSLEVPFIPRLLSEVAHSRTGIDIHPGATIARGCFIDHGTGVVIGESAVIGAECTLYQGVTLGALRFEHDVQGRVVRGAKRHPTLEEGVTVYANATILGGQTIIGAGSIVGADVFLTKSVPAGSKTLGSTRPPRSRRAR